MKRTRSASFSSESTTDACAMPTDACSMSDFTMSGKASRGGRFTFRPIGNTANSGTRMR